MKECTELELLAQANLILDVATEQEIAQDIKLFILAAQHKLELLKSILE